MGQIGRMGMMGMMDKWGVGGNGVVGCYHRPERERQNRSATIGCLVTTNKEQNGKDGLDGAMVGQGWDGRTLAGAGTRAPPLALGGKRAMRSGSCNQYCRCGVFVSDK